MAKQKLSKTQEAVLVFLYERKDGGETSAEAISAGTRLSKSEVMQALTELKEMGMVGGPPSLAEVTAARLKEMDPKLKPTDKSYAEHMLLLASLISKADESFLATELGFDREFVATVGARLRAGGVWDGDALSEGRLKAWEKDSLAFYCDVCIAAGDLKVVGGTPDNPQLQMTKSGIAGVKNALGKR